MKAGPNIAHIAALIGEPGRANMLTALMDGGALTASELAGEAGITKQTASTHLGLLVDGGLLAREIQGRHHYFRLSSPEVARAVEALMGLADRRGPTRIRPGPKDPALRKARICYDHIAGELGVGLLDRLFSRRWLAASAEVIAVTDQGRKGFEAIGIDATSVPGARRPLCRPCLDWSIRRHHLAGRLGARLFDRFVELDWVRRTEGTRILTVSRAGSREIPRWPG